MKLKEIVIHLLSCHYLGRVELCGIDVVRIKRGLIAA